jgi:MFS family permease
MLALPAGALADVVDRRKMLLFTQGWMLAIAAALASVTFFQLTSPLLLLILTLAMGAGAAMNAPAWQATVPELVPRTELPAAVALTGLGLNLGRAIGPALGGIVVALAGAWAAFLLNAMSFLSVILVLYSSRRCWQSSPPPRERVPGAIRAGIRYARHAPALRAVLTRTALVLPFASAPWALLPIVARYHVGLGSVGYGVLFGCLGAGSVAGAIILPGVQRRLSMDSLVAGGIILFAAASLSLAKVRYVGVLFIVMIGGGAAWIALMASLNLALHRAAPSWVRARVLGLYVLIFQFCMAAGSLVWGAVAQYAGLSAAFLYAAIGLTAGLALAGKYRLDGSEHLDLTPSAHWPEPTVPIKLRPDDGPVLVTVEYRIDPKHAREFALAMKPVRQQRLRDGAFRASLYFDPANPRRYVETFVVESWAEHLRQHERLTVTDRIAEERALAFHVGDEPPLMSHYIYAHAPDDAQ